MIFGVQMERLSILLSLAPQRELKENTYRFRDFFQIDFVNFVECKGKTWPKKTRKINLVDSFAHLRALRDASTYLGNKNFFSVKKLCTWITNMYHRLNVGSL